MLRLSRSPVLGPLVQAGVLSMGLWDTSYLSKLGIKESKKLTPKRREEISNELLKWNRTGGIGQHLAFKVWQPKVIDQYVQAHHLNLMEAEGIGMIAKQLRADYIMIHRIQQSGISKLQWSHVLHYQIAPIHVIDHEDEELLVAAASILATWTRTILMKHQREQGMTVGTGEPFNGKTREFIRTHPESPLIRKEWITFKKIMAESD